jgi:hypothetical protein
MRSCLSCGERCEDVSVDMAHSEGWQLGANQLTLGLCMPLGCRFCEGFEFVDWSLAGTQCVWGIEQHIKGYLRPAA